jgi:predicted ATPase
MPLTIKPKEQGKDPELTPGTLYLEKDSWNDWWEYKNQYIAQYVNRQRELCHLGLVKIEDPEQQPQDDPMHPDDQDIFGQGIASKMLSLGQSEHYYEQLANLPEQEREEFCLSINDSVWNPTRLKQAKNKPAMRKSLLRNVPISNILGELSRILRKEGEQNYYHLKYTQSELTAEFRVNPSTRPRTNLHVLIGRNGVGKTTLLRRLAETLVTGASKPDEALQIIDQDGHEADSDTIAGVQYISWGPFDKFAAADKWKLQSGVSYAQINLDGIDVLKPDKGFERPEVAGFDVKDFGIKNGDIEEPYISFARSFGLVAQRSRGEIWKDSVEALESDPEFKRLPILDTLRCILDTLSNDQSNTQIDFPNIAKQFSRLSEGHQAVLLTITYASATLTEQTLVVLDEPEAHLHPPLLSSLIKCLTDLLARKNAMAIVATHSPVVLQEVTRDCVLKISGGQDVKFASRPRVETFGEDVGALTYEIFELEVEDSGYFRTLKELASRFDNYDDALASIGNKLGVSGRSTLRTLINIEHPTDSKR